MKLIVKNRTTILCDRCHGRGPFTKGEVCDGCRAPRKTVDPCLQAAMEFQRWVDAHRAKIRRSA